MNADTGRMNSGHLRSVFLIMTMGELFVIMCFERRGGDLIWRAPCDALKRRSD